MFLYPFSGDEFDDDAEKHQDHDGGEGNLHKALVEVTHRFIIQYTTIALARNRRAACDINTISCKAIVEELIGLLF